MNSERVVVIGGGAAGMMAAYSASLNYKEVVLLEKNDRLGKKIFISGKGRCNITNDCEIEDLIKNVPGNGKFLYSAFYTYSNQDLMDFFENNGLKLKVERGNRVFPQSDKSSDVIRIFEKVLIKNNVDIQLNSPVSEVLVKDGSVNGVKTKDGKFFPCNKVILCTGGKSYPGTGSTGEGHKIAERLGHTIEQIRPSLVPLVAKEEWVPELQGLSLKNVEVKAVFKNKVLIKEFGEMIFTHYGISGPIILTISRHILDYIGRGVKVSINLKPALTEEQLDSRIQRDFDKYSRKQFKNGLDELLPQKLIPIIIQLSRINPEKEINQITKEERKSFAHLLTNFEVEIKSTRPIEEAIVTAGGVSTKEINPSTLESKLVRGLYFAGELIDVDGYTGGFNLQIAFSTGYLAGLS